MNPKTIPKPAIHSWRVTGTIPNSDQRYQNYGENFSVGVVAETIEAALDKARAMIPDAMFFSVHHYGPIHVS